MAACEVWSSVHFPPHLLFLLLLERHTTLPTNRRRLGSLCGLILSTYVRRQLLGPGLELCWTSELALPLLLHLHAVTLQSSLLLRPLLDANARVTLFTCFLDAHMLLVVAANTTDQTPT